VNTEISPYLFYCRIFVLLTVVAYRGGEFPDKKSLRRREIALEGKMSKETQYAKFGQLKLLQKLAGQNLAYCVSLLQTLFLVFLLFD